MRDRNGQECGDYIPREESGFAISPDDKNGYRVFPGLEVDEKGAIWIFDRNPVTGSLVQKRGRAGCIAEARLKGCVRGRAMDYSFNIEASSDGRNVYVASDNSVAIFDRDPSTGALTQKPGSEGSDPAARAGDIIVSPDGGNVYAVTRKHDATSKHDAITTFARDPGTGALTRVPGPAGCISEQGREGCRRGREFPTYGLSISPDGRNVYGVGVRFFENNDSAALKILDRLPDGTLVQKPGRAGCFSNYSHGEGCAEAQSLRGAGETAVTADGKRVYVFTSIPGWEAVFIRHPSGRLTEAPED